MTRNRQREEKVVGKPGKRTPLRSVPLNRAFTFIEEGPVVLVVTARNDKPNVMTASWTMCMGFEPTVGVVLGPWNYSYQSLLDAGECVLAIPGTDLMEAVVDIGNCSGEDVDKFKRFGLTALPAAKVKAPLVVECLANLECRVVEPPSDRHLFVLEGVKAWRNPSRTDQRAFHAKGDGTFIIEGERVDLRHRMTRWQHCI